MSIRVRIMYLLDSNTRLQHCLKARERSFGGRCYTFNFPSKLSALRDDNIPFEHGPAEGPTER